jgi:S-adenosylmethionine hydrolase
VSVHPAEPRVSGTGRMVDRFGNILSDIPRSALERAFGASACRVSVGGVDAGPLRRTYADGVKGELLAIVNSWDRVEAAVREGRAVDRFAGAGARGVRFDLRPA